MTTPLGPIGAVGATTGPRETGSASDALDKDAFMKLLVAQLKYQNPMAPADGQQYMSQMAVFAQVEKLEQLVTAQQEQSAWQHRIAAEGLVGRTVTGLDDTAGSVTGVVRSVVHDTTGSHLVLADGTELDPDSVTRVTQG